MGFYKPTVSVSQFNSLQSQVNTNTSNISSLQSQVNTNTTNINTLLATQFFNTYVINFPVGGYRTHMFGNGATTGSSSGVTAAQNALDAYPFPIVEPSVVCDKMAVIVYAIATSGIHSTICGIYTDNNGYPGTLIAQTPVIDVSTTGWRESTFTGGNITLNRGLYWLARISGGNTQFYGINCGNAIPCGVGMAPPDSTIDQLTTGTGIHAVRYTYGSFPSSLPTTFPTIASGAKWLSRSTYASPWIHRAS